MKNSRNQNQRKSQDHEKEGDMEVGGQMASIVLISSCEPLDVFETISDKDPSPCGLCLEDTTTTVHVSYLRE